MSTTDLRRSSLPRVLYINHQKGNDDLERRRQGLWDALNPCNDTNATLSTPSTPPFSTTPMNAWDDLQIIVDEVVVDGPNDRNLLIKLWAAIRVSQCCLY